MRASIDTAVILAAGMGSRFGEITRRVPKGLLCLGPLSIIEESILRLQQTGVRRIVIVTGHLAESYEPLRTKYQGLIETIYNPFYAESGSMYSLYCAKEHLDGDFLLLESDLIYERRAISSCLESPYNSAILLSGCTNAGDEVFVEVDQGRLMNMSKRRESLGHNVVGEFVGISKISRKLYAMMIEEAVRNFGGTHRVEYDLDCLTAVAKKEFVHCQLVKDLIWSEIDDRSQFIRARESIYPKILKGQG